jgi:hypothetical protein
MYPNYVEQIKEIATFLKEACAIMNGKKLFKTSIFILLGVVAAGAQTFPPVAVTGPFPKGTETKRNDAPVDSLRASSPMIYSETAGYCWIYTIVREEKSPPSWIVNFRRGVIASIYRLPAWREALIFAD